MADARLLPFDRSTIRPSAPCRWVLTDVARTVLQHAAQLMSTDDDLYGPKPELRRSQLWSAFTSSLASYLDSKSTMPGDVGVASVAIDSPTREPDFGSKS